MAAHTAHNFPDLDISPILPLDESRRDSDSSLQITVPLDYVPDGGGIFTSTAQGSSDVVPDSQTRVEENPDVSTNFDVSLDSVGPRPTKDSLENSSEEVFKRLQNNVQRTLLTSRSSGEDLFEEEEVDAGEHSCMSSFLQGLMIYVDFQCCVESAQTIRSKLRKMGAIVTRHLSAANSHVVFSRGGRKSTLQTILSMENRPFLVDPDWVHACWFQQFRVPENGYNLYGCQYLLETLRRRSSAVNDENLPIRESASTDVIELSHDIELEPNLGPKRKESHPRACSSLSLSEETELTFDQPMTATQLLQKIDKLSKRLDDLNTSPNPSHGSRCPSRQGDSSRRTPLKSKGTNTVAFTPAATKPLRRRTHGAFALAHRAPFSAAVSAMTALKEETEAEQGMQDLTNRLNTIALNRKGPVNGVDDMRKTTQTDLNRIRQTLKNNSKYQKRKQKDKNNKSRPPVPPPQPRRAPEESQEDSEDSFHRTPRVPIRRPVVNTASDIINRLQNIPSSDEFAGNKQSRIKKMAIVFTGINRMEERTFRQIALDLSLTISNKVDHRTRCVVSGNGLRTLSTLRAVVLGIPVVTPEWLNDCDAEECLLSAKKYVYNRWNDIIQQRKPKSSLFARFRWIYVADGCSPPSDELKWMIKKSGGQITPCAEDSTIIVSPKDQEIELPWNPSTQRDPPLIVNEQYILDCITENQVLTIEDYANASFSILD